TGLQREQHAGGFLQGKVAGGPGIGVAEAEQEVDVGCPWTDSMDGSQRPMRIVSADLGERPEFEITMLDRLRNRSESLDFPLRKSGGCETRSASAQQRSMIERLDLGSQSVPNCLRARGGELLRDYDRSKSRKARLPPTERRRFCAGERMRKSW